MLLRLLPALLLSACQKTYQYDLSLYDDAEYTCVIKLVPPQNRDACVLEVDDPPAKVVVDHWYSAPGVEALRKEFSMLGTDAARWARLADRVSLAESPFDLFGSELVQGPATLDPEPGKRETWTRRNVWSEEAIDTLYQAILGWSRAWHAHAERYYGPGEPVAGEIDTEYGDRALRMLDAARSQLVFEETDLLDNEPEPLLTDILCEHCRPLAREYHGRLRTYRKLKSRLKRLEQGADGFSTHMRVQRLLRRAREQLLGSLEALTRCQETCRPPVELPRFPEPTSLTATATRKMDMPPWPRLPQPHTLSAGVDRDPVPLEPVEDPPCESDTAEGCLPPEDCSIGAGCLEPGEAPIEIVLVDPRDGNNPFDPDDPLAEDAEGTGGTGSSGTGGFIGGGFDFNLLVTPTDYFLVTTPVGASCGIESTYISFDGSILTLSFFYGNDPTTFATSYDFALSQSSDLTILGQPGHVCTLTPSDADTFTIECRNTSTGATCGDVWTRQ